MNGRGNKRANTFDEIIVTKRLKVGVDVEVTDDSGNLGGGGGGTFYSFAADPSVNDDDSKGYNTGDRWTNTVSSDTFTCFDNTNTMANWVLDADATVMNAHITQVAGEDPHGTLTGIEATISANSSVAANTAHAALVAGQDPHGTLTGIETTISANASVAANTAHAALNAGQDPHGTLPGMSVVLDGTDVKLYPDTASNVMNVNNLDINPNNGDTSLTPQSGKLLKFGNFSGSAACTLYNGGAVDFNSSGLLSFNSDATNANAKQRLKIHPNLNGAFAIQDNNGTGLRYIEIKTPAGNKEIILANAPVRVSTAMTCQSGLAVTGTCTVGGANVALAGHTHTPAEVGLGNVTNESKATMFDNPTLTNTVIADHIHAPDGTSIVVGNDFWHTATGPYSYLEITDAGPVNINAAGADLKLTANNVDVQGNMIVTGTCTVGGTNVSAVGHTHTATDITDFDTEVGNNTSVAANTTHAGLNTNPHGVTKAQVGLANVTDESKATMFSNPTLTGTVIADHVHAPDGSSIVVGNDFWHTATGPYSYLEVQDGGAVNINAAGADIKLTATNIAFEASGSNGYICVEKADPTNLVAGNGAGAALNSNGLRNICIGQSAGAALDVTDDCTLIGFEAGKAANAGGAVGTTCIGHKAGAAITTSGQNVVVGGNAVSSGVAGVGNTVTGYAAASTNGFTGIRNTINGNYGGRYITSGDRNVCIGAYAGADSSIGITTGNDNTVLGSYAEVGQANSYAVAIGAEAECTASRQMTLGSDDNTVLGKKSLLEVRPGTTDGSCTLGSGTHRFSTVYCTGVDTTGQIQGALGTASTPGYSFTGDTDTGIYLPAANEIGVACNGTEIVRVNEAEVVSQAPIRATTGLINNPTYSFIGDPDTGIYQPVAGQVSVTCNGATNTVFDPTGLTIEGSKLFRHGAVIQDTGNDAFVHFEMSWPVSFDADVKGGGTANISDGLIKGTTQYATSVTSYSKSHNMTVNEATGVITCDVTGDYEVTYSISGQMLANNSIHLVEDSTTTPTLVGEGHFVEDHAVFKTISKSGIYTLTATKNYQLAVLSPGTVVTTTVLNMLGYSITMKRLRTSDE